MIGDEDFIFLGQAYKGSKSNLEKKKNSIKQIDTSKNTTHIINTSLGRSVVFFYI